MNLFFVTVLLVCQLLGEVLTRLLDLPLPGPVIGMLILLVGLLLRGQMPDGLQATAEGLLGNLSLLFVPAGVGVVTHIALVAEEWLAITVALVASTVAAIAVTAWLMAWLARRLGQPPAGAARKDDGEA